MKHRFKVIEYSSGFAVEDTKTKKEAWISDGVDILSTPTGKSVSPGSKGFVGRLQKSLNENPDETLEAYFPEQYDSEFYVNDEGKEAD